MKIISEYDNTGIITIKPVFLICFAIIMLEPASSAKETYHKIEFLHVGNFAVIFSRMQIIKPLLFPCNSYQNFYRPGLYHANNQINNF